MGILNVTPDSFYDGGTHEQVQAAVASGVALARAGARIIDVGGESTRPGAERVAAEQQRRRVLPVIAALRAALDDAGLEAWISVDTTRAEVAEPALDAGADMLNDVSAGREDERMLTLAAQRGVPIVLMHMRGEPGTMQRNPAYTDVVAEVRAYLLKRAAAAEAAGATASQIVLDPGIGFGKRLEHNLALLARLDAFVATGHPVLLGTSRKRFIEYASPTTSSAAADRLGGTCATTALAVDAGVRLFRVHDVRENLQAAELAQAVELGEPLTAEG